MKSTGVRPRGVTLIELMVSLAVLAIVLAVAVPSFADFRQRSALRGAADQAASLWSQARFEAAKRNSLVKVGFVTSGTNYCIGVATTTNTADSTACDCLTAGACNVAAWPSDQGEWRGVTISGTPTLGANTGVVVIEPKRTSLTELGDAGVVQFAGPPGRQSYRLNLRVDRFGRVLLCESNSVATTGKLPEYSTRRCAP